jgi:hypothetical protein
MAKQTQQPKVEKVNRQQAANRIVAAMKAGEKTTLSELTAKADALVGGEPKPKETAWHVKRALATAEALRSSWSARLTFKWSGCGNRPPPSYQTPPGRSERGFLLPPVQVNASQCRLQRGGRPRLRTS